MKSWPDHNSRNFIDSVSSISTLQTGTNLSDHLPLLANLSIGLTTFPVDDFPKRSKAWTEPIGPALLQLYLLASA